MNKDTLRNTEFLFGKSVNILVLAPSFPSINQPWIDTYLEQLIKQGIKPLIVTCNKMPGKYSEKVDRLKLRNHVVAVDINRVVTGSAFIKTFVLHPLRFIQSLIKAIGVSRYLIIKYRLSILPTVFKSLRSIFIRSKLDHTDLIHSHDEVLAFEFMFHALMWKKPLVYTFHGLVPQGVPSLANAKRKALYGELSVVLVNTNFSKQLAQHINCPAEKIIVLPQGLPLEDFPFITRSVPEKNKPLKLLTVGRYHADKGQRYALQALRSLRDKGISAKWNFVGVGPDLDKLIAIAENYGIDEHVSFYEGLTSQELCSLYQQCHLFVLPSLNNRHLGEHVETQGVVLQEAQASGCIPIATRVGGIPECLNDKEDAILIKDRSSSAIADAVMYLLNRPDEWLSYQKKGRCNAEQNFSADVIGKRMAEILTTVVNGTRSV